MFFQSAVSAEVLVSEARAAKAVEAFSEAAAGRHKLAAAEGRTVEGRASKVVDANSSIAAVESAKAAGATDTKVE